MSNKTIAVFTDNKILNTQANQKCILQALFDGFWFKDLESEIVLLDLVFPDFDDETYQKSEVRVISLSKFSEYFRNGDLEHYGIDDNNSYLYFINFEQVVEFNIGEI